MTTINREFLQSLNADINEALAEIAKKHGVSIQTGKGRFEANNAQITLNIGTISEEGFVNTREAEDFRFHAPKFGIDPAVLGTTITYGPEQYTIIGMLPRSKKMPILAKQIRTGKTMKLPVCAVA